LQAQTKVATLVQRVSTHVVAAGVALLPILHGVMSDVEGSVVMTKTTVAPVPFANPANIKYRALNKGEVVSMIVWVKDEKGRQTGERRPQTVRFLGAGYVPGDYLTVLPEPKASTGLHFWFETVPGGVLLTADVDVGSTGTALLLNKQRVTFNKPNLVTTSAKKAEPAKIEPVAEQTPVTMTTEHATPVDEDEMTDLLRNAAGVDNEPAKIEPVQGPVAETKTARRARLKAEKEAAEAAKAAAGTPVQEPVAEQIETPVEAPVEA